MLTVPAAEDIAVAVPPSLGRFGETVLARVSGNRDGPVVIALGGISADRFAAVGRDGGPGWWPGMVGAGRAIDPARNLIVGIDFAADETGRAAPSTFDQAEILSSVLDAVGTSRATLVGASYGGMVALALAASRPERVERLVVISAPAAPHPAATAARELQRRVVALGLAGGRGVEALAIARGMAMLGYRTREEFGDRFEGGIDKDDPLACSDPGHYLRARGEAYRAVMSPCRFLSLSASLDRHGIDPSLIEAPALLIGATSDQIVPPAQMRALADALPNAVLHLLDCPYGHDMFLKESTQIGALVAPFLEDA